MKKLKQLLMVMAIALTGFTPAQAQTWTHYSEWMANTQKSYVYNNDYWRYDDGLMYESILDTYEHYKNGGSNIGDETLKNAVKAYIDACINSSGSITNYKSGDLDDIRPARMVYKYYKLYGGNNLLTACQTVMNCNAFKDDTRVTINGSKTGNPWQHKGDYTEQVWLDGIFMGIPFWTLAGPDGVSSSHHSSWTANDYFDDAINQMNITDAKTYENTNGLWCHAWDATSSLFWATKTGSFLNNTYKDKHSPYELVAHNGRSSHCWGRALGWYAMAIMETMDNIRAKNGVSDSRITTLKALFKKVMDKVVETRDPSAGVWHCVIDVDATQAPYSSYSNRNNYLEATCSSMFVYCLLHGVAQNYLDSSYLPIAKDAYNKLISTFITTSNGLKLEKCMSVGGLGPDDNTKRDGSYAYYMSESIVDNDSKGVGPFIWASLEAEKTYGYTISGGFDTDVASNDLVQFRWSRVADDYTVPGTTPSSFVSPTFTAKTSGGTTLTNSSDITFVSDNKAVATVDANGTITLAGEAGTANIKATMTSGAYVGEAIYTVTTTGTDTTKPTLSSSTPATGATDVAVSGNIVLTFSEAVTIADASKFSLSGGAGTLNTAGATVSGATVTIPYSGLANSTTYTLNIAAGAVKDLAENTNDARSDITFTTIAPDLTAPSLSSHSITDGATDVATSGTIVLTFSEAVTCTTNATLTTTGSSAINLTPTVSGSTVTYSYSGLSNSTSYTFNLPANSVADLAGNNYASAINFSFTTTTETDKYYILAYTEMTPAGVLTSASNSNQSLKYVKYNGSTYATTSEISSDFPSNKNGKYSNSSITNILNTSNWASGSGSSYATGIVLSKNTTYTLNLGSNNISKISFLCYPAGNTSSISIGGTAKTTSTKEWTLHEWSGSFTGEVSITLSNANDIYGVFVLEKASGSTPPTPSTYTLTNTVNPEGYGTVSPTTVANIPSGTATTSSSNTYTVGGTEVTATPAKATAEYTYAFSGWSGLPATVTANKTVTAIFTRTANSYTLAWNKNAEDADDLTGDYTSGTVPFGTAITAPNNPTRDGYTFNGWKSTQDGSGTAPTGTMPAANTTYYAQWTENTLPAAPEFSPEEGNVNGGTEVSITSTDATTIYYQISESSTPLAIGNSGWSTYSSAVVLPNITGTRYLHAYGANATGNSTVSTAIYTLTENAGGSTTATYTFDDGRALATDWDVTTSVPTGGTAVCEITNSLSGATFSAKDNKYLGLGYKDVSNVGITITTTATYSNITEISIDAVAGDNGKPTFAAYIVTGTGEVEVFAAVGSKDGFSTGGTNKWGNKTVTLTTPLTGKLKIVTTASSSGKYAALDNIAITTEAGASTKVATPTITGTTPFASNTNVTISCDTEEATIYYTTNGDTPTTSSTEYSAPFNISATTTVKAIAVKDGMTNSNVAEETFTLDNTKPTVTMTTPATTTDVAINTSSLVLTVSEDITAVGGTIAGTFDGNAITFTRTNATTLTYSIPSTLTNSKTYNVTLSANQIQDAAGNQNDAANFSFTTAAAAPSPSSDGTELYTFSMSGSTINFAHGDSENFSITNNKSCEINNSNIKFRWHKDANTYGKFTLTSTNDIPIQSVKLVGTIEGGSQEYQDVTVTPIGTYDSETMTWTANSDNVTSVTFTNNYSTSSNGNILISKIIVVYYAPETITIAEAGFSTLYKTYAVSVGDGGTAYYVSDIRNKNVVLTPFDNNIIPANTGAVIKGTFGDEVTLNRAIADEFTTTNYLLGTDTKQNIPAEKDKYYYFISGRQKQADNSYKYGWLVPNALKTTSVFSNNANKAYLQIPKAMLDNETSARILSLIWEDVEQPIATGIDGFATDNGFIVIDDNTPLYNLSGQRVSKSYKGIVIVNGKKVLRK